MAKQRFPGPVHESLRQLVSASENIVGDVPDKRPLKGSQRDAEQQELIRTSGGGGRERARLHDRLNFDAMAFVVNTGILVSGVADLFDIGMAKDEVNPQALTVLVRAPTEMTAQMLWLLDPALDADERVRRYLMWRLSDLNSQRLIVLNAEPDDEDPDELARHEAILSRLEEKESEVIGWVEAAKWEAHYREVVSGSERAPALLDTSNPNKVRRLSIPKINELVRAVTDNDLVYAMLSVPSHGDRWAVMDTMETTGERTRDGRHRARVEGFGLDPNLIKALAKSAVALPTIGLASWNGLDRSELIEPVKRLDAVTFT